MLITTDKIIEILKDDDDIKNLNLSDKRLRANIRSLLTEYQKYWGVVPKQSQNHISRGRPIDLYQDFELFRANKKYWESYGHLAGSKASIRMKIVKALQRYLEWMDVTEDTEADESPEAIKNRLFKKK